MSSKNRRSGAKKSRTARKQFRRFGFEALEGRSLLTALFVTADTDTKNGESDTIALVQPEIGPDVTSVPTVVVTDSGGTYSGLPFAATATVNGTASLENVSPTFAYHTGTTVGGSSTSSAPSIVGTYTVVASFAGSTDFTSALSNPVTFTISKAAPSITVTDASGTYKNAAFTATTASLEGVTPSLTYYSGTAPRAQR